MASMKVNEEVKRLVEIAERIQLDRLNESGDLEIIFWIWKHPVSSKVISSAMERIQMVGALREQQRVITANKTLAL